MNLWATKSVSALRAEAEATGEHSLKRKLGPLNLITLGIGAIIGAGIFVLTGQAAALHAGPAVPISMILVGIACTFAGLCYAEYAVADWGRTTPIPANNVSWEQAATYPVALGTMHDAIVTNAKLQRGEAIMIQGASSGVGLLGLQIAKLRGAKLVIGTSTNDARRARLKEFGADLVIDPRKANWSEDVLKATDGKGAEVVIDMISGPTVNENMKAAAVLGRIVNVGRLGGGHIEFDCNLHANKRIAYIGVTHRTRSMDELRAEVSNMRADLWDAVSAGKLSLPIDRVFKLDDAEAAQAHMRTNAHFGKIVMVP